VDFTWTGADWLVALLLCWLALGIGFVMGWAGRVSFERHHRGSVPVEAAPAPKTAPSPTPHTQKIDFSQAPPPVSTAGHPLRRASDRPGGPEPEVRPGGRRRSDAPAMTRAEARRLREQGYPDPDTERPRQP